MNAEVKKWVTKILNRALDCNEDGSCVWVDWNPHVSSLEIRIQRNGYVCHTDPAYEEPEKYDLYLKGRLANPPEVIVDLLQTVYTSIDIMLSQEAAS